ncbi:hypothetical protein OSB04_015650 [Centaurea solstitialis]|uniref:Protein FAR1-RELATED SEQUENCE n=1 Tax=Centaurea solstitialis TaxID=347529 RepID=A0AA38TBE9_9ASTR|nr:hypothetical protein OSB04_015650 [Centaurea solstitialis]
MTRNTLGHQGHSKENRFGVYLIEEAVLGPAQAQEGIESTPTCYKLSFDPVGYKIMVSDLLVLFSENPFRLLNTGAEYGYTSSILFLMPESQHPGLTQIEQGRKNLTTEEKTCGRPKRLAIWQPIYLLEYLKDGSILIVYHEDKLSKTIKDAKLFMCYFTEMSYRPNFIKLQNFESERVHTFQTWNKDSQWNDDSSDENKESKFSTDMVFSSRQNLIDCVHHVGKTLGYRRKLVRSTSTWNSFNKAWTTLVASQTEDAYKLNLAQLETILLDYSVWLTPYKEMFVHCWTDKYLNFGNHTTNRVESQHAKLKRYLDLSKSQRYKM